MGCCGQKRQALKATMRGRGSGVMLEYREQRPVEVRGEATGQTYVFSHAQPLQTVDPRDAPGLLRSPAFRER